MEYRRLGNSGLKVSLVGLGCNNFGVRTPRVEDTKAIVHKALDLGVNLLDTADAYANRGGSEEHLGQVLGDRRKDVVLATKFGLAMDDAGRLKGGSRGYIMRAVEASLRRLKTDWIDLYQLHRPDPETPIEETLRALDDLVRQGKVRYIGCSNLVAWEVVQAQWTSRSLGLNAFVSCQDEYNLLNRAIEKDLVPAMQAYGLGLLPYFPLASGVLTGKYKRNAAVPEGSRFQKAPAMKDQFLTEHNWSVLEGIEAFCARRGLAMTDLAFVWLASRPTVASVIAGASSPAQVEQNVRSVALKLSADDLAELDRITAR